MVDSRNVKFHLRRGLSSVRCSRLLLVSCLLSLSTAFVSRRPSVGYRFRETLPIRQLYAAGSTDEGEKTTSWTDGGRISVTVEKNVASISDVNTFREAWLEHHWKKGGGLPIFVVIKNDDVDDFSRRVVMPIMMEEEARVKKGNNSSSVVIEYTVSKPGWAFQSDLVANSHFGSVAFVPLENDGPGCKMIWKVEFDAIRFRGLYQAVTELTIGTAARTVVESLGTPRLLTVRSALKGVSDPIDARREWLEYFWARGGGLPLPPPISKGEVLEEGGGTARRSIVRVPPLLVDTILSTSRTEDSADAVYRIENPGWTTFPFLIHTHLGRVRFARTTSGDGEREEGDAPGGVDVTWEIEIRPFPWVAPIVEKLLEMTASTIVRNLAVRFAEPGATVEIGPPSGDSNLAGGIDGFGSIPKDIWLGGVLDMHLKDDRSAAEQTLSMVQPWSWGRTGDGSEDDTVTFGWSGKSMVS